jgi:hypothetical protein
MILFLSISSLLLSFFPDFPKYPSRTFPKCLNPSILLSPEDLFQIPNLDIRQTRSGGKVDLYPFIAGLNRPPLHRKNAVNILFNRIILQKREKLASF